MSQTWEATRMAGPQVRGGQQEKHRAVRSCRALEMTRGSGILHRGRRRTIEFRGTHIIMKPPEEVRWDTGVSGTMLTYFTVLPGVDSTRQCGMVAGKAATRSFACGLESPTR